MIEIPGLGVFNTIKEALEVTGISNSTYRYRISHGWDKIKAMTTPLVIESGKRKSVEIPGVGTFNSIREACNYFGTPYERYASRISNGMDKIKAITLPVGESSKSGSGRKGEECTDHLGNRFESIAEMCRYYNIPTSRFKKRLDLGWTLEKALTSSDICKDHLGNRFESIDEMCKHYGIHRTTFYRRLKQGLTLKQTLELGSKQRTYKEKQQRKIIEHKDHLGIEYGSIDEMCKHYGIHKTTFYRRLKSGYNISEALTLPLDDRRTKKENKEVDDHLGNRYKSFEEMCKAYNIEADLVQRRLYNGMTLKEALLMPVIKYRIIKSHIGIDGKQYYKIKIHSKRYYLNTEQIIEYTNKGIFERKQDVE